ncbi:MAG: DUF2225 domain-containing protein [Treponemataceae bacterium]|nr:MAG: DUF2225 domain-containing protein [Treponemataceae bacterium]
MAGLTFRSKQKTECPVCEHEFHKEEILTGGGRMIAGPLTDELRRVYEPGKKFGAVYPFMYTIGACPVCHTAFFWSDFKAMAKLKDMEKFMESSEKRQASVQAVFPNYDLAQDRTILDGAAAFYLALLCYEDVDAEFFPTMKRALVALRLAWLSGEIHAAIPGHNYDFVQKVFYRKAMFFYQQAITTAIQEKEHLQDFPNFGPDIDKNYGYDGLTYMCGLLEYKYGQTEDMGLRLQKLNEYKIGLARIFGLGRSSKNKPGPLLEHSRALYDNLKKTLAAANIFDEDD